MKDNLIDFTTFCQMFQRKLETHYEAPWPLPTDWAEPTPEEADVDGVDIREAGKSIMGEDLFNSFIYGDKEQWLKTLNELTAKQLGAK